MPLLKQEELKKQIDKLKDKDGEEFCKNLRKKKLQVEASYKTSEKAPPTPLTESERNNLDIDFNNTLLEIPLLQKEIELSRGDKRLKKGAIIIDNIGKLLDLAKILEKELDNSDELMQLRKSLVEAKEVAASSGENLNVANKSALIKEKEIEILNSKKEIYLTIKVASDSLSIFKESDKSKVKKNNHNSSNINTATNSSANFYPEFNSNIKKLNLKIESFEEELKNKIADVKPTNDTRSGTGIVHNNLEKHILESKKYYNRATHSSLQEELIKALSNNNILIQESQAIGSALTEGEEIFDTVAIDLETNLQRINDLKAYKEALRQVIDILGLPKNTDTHALLDHLKKSFSPAQNLKIALGLADIDLVDEAAIRKQVDAVFESRDPNKDVINLIKSPGLTANDTKEDVIKAAKKILIEPSLKDKIKEAQDAVRKMFVIDDNASSDEIAAAVKTVRESSRSDDSLRKEYQKFKTSLGLDSTALVSVVIPKVQEILGKLPPSLDPVKTRIRAILGINGRTVDHNAVAVAVTRIVTAEGVVVGREVDYDNLISALGTEDVANFDQIVESVKRTLNKMDPLSLAQVKNELSELLGNPTNAQETAEAIERIRTPDDDESNNANKDRAKLAALLGVDLTNQEAAKNAARRTLDQVISLDAVKNELNALLNNPISPQEVEERIVAIRDAVDNGDGVADEARARLAALLGVVDGANHEAQVNASKRILNQMDVASLDAVKNEIRAILGNPTNDEALTQALTNVRNLVDDGTNHANETRARLAALLGVDNLTDIEAAKNAARRTLDQVISLDAVKNELNALLNNPTSPQEVEERIVAIRDLEDDGDNHANAVRDRLAALLGVVDGETHEAQVNASKRILNQMDAAAIEAVQTQIKTSLEFADADKINETTIKAKIAALRAANNARGDNAGINNLADLLGVNVADDRFTGSEVEKSAAIDAALTKSAKDNLGVTIGGLEQDLAAKAEQQELQRKAIKEDPFGFKTSADAFFRPSGNDVIYYRQQNSNSNILNDEAVAEKVKQQRVDRVTNGVKAAVDILNNGGSINDIEGENLRFFLSTFAHDSYWSNRSSDLTQTKEEAVDQYMKLRVPFEGNIRGKTSSNGISISNLEATVELFFPKSGSSRQNYRNENSESSTLTDSEVDEKVKKQMLVRVTNGVRTAVETLKKGDSIDGLKNESLKFFLCTFAYDSYLENRSNGNLQKTKKVAIDQYNSCDEAALDNLLIPSTITPLRNPSTHLSSGINITPKPPTADDRSFKRSTSINRSSTGFERK